MTNVDVKSNFQFKGFVPNKKIREKSEVFYNLVERRSPSDSKKLAVLKKAGDFYVARLKVSSASSCSFDISCKENNVSNSISSLQKQFFDKILKWNQTRQPRNIPLKK